jgi:hypothetical protein
MGVTAVLAAGLGGAVPLDAQQTAGGEAERAIVEWLALVNGGDATQAWNQASFRFQYRIGQRSWQEWVAAYPTRLTGLGSRRTIELTLGRDEPPLEPLEWARVVYARDRAAGGRVFERVIALREGDDWRVADYQTWPDDKAAVTNTSLLAVPYRSGYAGQFLPHGYWRGGRLLRRIPRQPPPPAADRPSARANPTTFPRRPPE